MELFSLLAKLTLDSTEFDQALKDAERDARSLDIETPELGLDKDEFDAGIEEAQDEIVEDQEPKIGIDTQEFDEGIDDAEEHGNLFGETMGNVFKELKGVLITSGIVAAVSSVVSSLKEGVELAKNHGDQIDKQSQKMGISAKAYQEWAYALNLSGASIDDLNRGLRTWQQAVGDEDATAKLASAFESLGMDAEKAIKQLESGENLDSLLDQVMYGLADYAESDRGAIAEILFGKNSTALNALFNATSKDIRDMKQEAEDLGMVMTDEEVKNAAAYMDATSRMEGAIQGLKEALVVDLLPFLTETANTIAKIVAFFNPRTGQKSLSDQFAGDDAAFAEELMTIEGTAAAAEALAQKLIDMGDTSKMTAEQYEIWKGTADELISLVPTLGDIIDVESGQIRGNTKDIKDNIREWENLAKQKALQELKEQKYQQIVEKNQALIDKSIEANKKAAQAEEAKVKAATQFSNKMKEYGLGQLDMNGDIDQQIKDVMSRLAENGDEYESELAGLGVSLKAYGEAATEAGKAQAEVDNLNKELEKGKADYQEWLSVAEAMYGMQAEEAKSAAKETETLDKKLRNLPRDIHTTIQLEYDTFGWSPRAIGDAYVPYDNFPALLHRGEKVVTATEARRERGLNNTDLSSLQSVLETAISNGMQNVQTTVIIDGREVAKTANQYNGKEIDSGRYRP